MSAVATIVQNSAPAVRKPGKEGRISAALRRAIDALVTGECKTQKEAAQLAGLAPEHLCRMLSKPHVEVFYDQRTRQTIGRARMRAAARTIALIDAGSEHVSLDAASRVLAISNIRPPDAAQANVNVNVSVGYVIDLTPGAPPSSAPDIRTQIIEHDQGGA
jgi:hypothetical protein